MAEKKNGKTGSTAPKSSGSRSGGKKSAYKPHWGIRIAIVLVVGVLLGVSLLFENQINLALGLEKIEKTEYDGTTAGDIRKKSVAGDLNVHFVDVGQGDACIVELPDGKKMIIDGGEKDAKDALLGYIDENITDKDGNKITYFDYAILTHTDSDHCGSLDLALLHISEPTRRTPISYAVLCLIKNLNSKDNLTYTSIYGDHVL